MNHASLICTVSPPESPEKLMIPRDGVCDFLFYDSLYIKSGDTLLTEPGPHLLTFLSAAASSTDTDYGCSVDIESATPMIQEALSSLKDLTELLELAIGKTGVTVLGIYSKAKFICETISNILGSQAFKPAAIIILGHISYNDWHSYGCRILPPNVYGVSRELLQKMFYGHLF
ncbi:hypothetical protein MTO96_008632, partial [Rhipicephalus appendiculatus]